MQRAARTMKNVNRKVIRRMTSIQCHFEKREATIINQREPALKTMHQVPKLATKFINCSP